MKKITKISILLNVILVITTMILVYSYNAIKRDLTLCKKNDKSSIINSHTTPTISIDKTDPIYIFNSKKFPCDSGASTYESNLCSGEKLHFADSLLNEVVKLNIKEFDKYIKQDKEGTLKAKDNTYFVNSLKTNIASKDNFIKAQKKWEELRVLNSEYVSIGCEGGTGCPGIVNSKEIKAVLDRIKEIKELYN